MESANLKTMKSVVVEEGRKVAIEDHPVPRVGDNDVLIRTFSVAQNPTDWKRIDNYGKPGTILGCDFSGYIVKVGKSVFSPKVGDHVAGCVHGGCLEDEGAYAEYIKTPADLVWVVPENTLDHDQAATLSYARWTAPPSKVSGEEWVLLFGGSPHASGYNIVTTASPRNFDLVRSLEADEVFDYKDPAIVAKIKKATGDSIAKAVDAIWELRLSENLR
ncbi:chaperonin 10-like protein [Dichomitus squalens]|uniref:Chaperonin 10-like protein n=1 Tax=Dichomitus squalens TaxID=114155 RepID=A0A4Q9N809_9APHY|nr:chaperonin 10-like protein [Dichomitus squalens]